MTVTDDGLPSPHLQTKIHEVQLFLAQNLAHDVDLNTIAAHAALSPYYFTRQFTAMVGMPPYRYLISLRIAARGRAAPRARISRSPRSSTGSASTAPATSRRPSAATWG